MTNQEYLDYLAHNAPDKLTEWFNAEYPNGEIDAKSAVSGNSADSNDSYMQQRVDKLVEQRDAASSRAVEYYELATAYKLENESLREQNRAMALTIANIRDTLEDDYR